MLTPYALFLASYQLCAKRLPRNLDTFGSRNDATLGICPLM